MKLVFKGGLLCFAFCALSVGVSVFIPLDTEKLKPHDISSLRIYDRNGILLREVHSAGGGRGQWCSQADISPHLVNAIVAAEDSRFYRHRGVDPVALARAAWQNLRAGRVVSGGSTLSMQVIRNVFHPRRTLNEKIREAWYALRLERMLSKNEILLQYLNRAPFGNQTFGVSAAARQYFAKPALQLSLAEAAFLAAIPKAPTMNDPYRHFARARARQVYVLGRMVKEGFITEAEMEGATREPLVLTPIESQFKAPHFTEMVCVALPKGERNRFSDVYTTLDDNVQKTCELLLRAHLANLTKKDVSNGAIVVVDNRKHGLVALVGSRDFFDSTTNGQVNGALALRQPGSTLKPFTYGIALESGMTAAELLADIPRDAGDNVIDFLPENYDKKFHGPVLLRTALACSYNVPAVRTVERFGEDVLLQKLHLAGFASLNQPASFYGVGLTLGNGEVTLMELANGYSALANNGVFSTLHFIDSVKDVHGATVAGWRATGGADIARGGDAGRTTDRQPEGGRVFSGQIAFILTDILSDAVARSPAFGSNSSLSLPFPCAAKTGTSKDYRDNWTVGYTPQYTVAVWVGNFDAKPMKLVSGITGAAPLFRDVMLALHASNFGSLPASKPEGITTANICPRSGMLVASDCPGVIAEYFIEGAEPMAHCNMHKTFTIDSRNGLLASQDTPGDCTEERVFEILPPMFRRWAEQEHIPLPPASTSSISTNNEMPLLIASPASGSIFGLDPVLRAEFQALPVETSVAPGVEEVSLWLNGERLIDLRPPYRFRLPIGSLQKGNYALMLKGRRGDRRLQSEVVRLTVQ